MPTVPPASALSPLAERLRPRTLGEVAGQRHLIGSGGPLAALVGRGALPSLILWGPPGVGKTTLAGLLAGAVGATFIPLNAVTSGVKDVREAIEQAATAGADAPRTVLFIDEIHRFNKAQQDALLGAVERGVVTLIGATTENPAFTVIPPLRSRCQVYRLESLSAADLRALLDRALVTDPALIGLELPDSEATRLVELSGGDARTLLNGLEAVALLLPPGKSRVVTKATVEAALQRRLPDYEATGEGHFDTISAFIKSVRGSDPDAALHYLARMLHAGEDPVFIARRLILLASEDIGNASPNGLVLAVAAAQAVERIGLPEGRIPLAQATTYLAGQPKSNAAYLGIDAALADVKSGRGGPIPAHLRNAPVAEMRSRDGNGVGYRYAHDYADGFAGQDHRPEALRNVTYYHPTEHGAEKATRDRLRLWWPKRYG